MKRIDKDSPTFTLAGKNWSMQVYVLDTKECVHLPYCRTDGHYFAGPGIVTVTKSETSGAIDVVEYSVNDASFWYCFAELIQKGINLEEGIKE